MTSLATAQNTLDVDDVKGILEAAGVTTSENTITVELVAAVAAAGDTEGTPAKIKLSIANGDSPQEIVISGGLTVTAGIFTITDTGFGTPSNT